jgi:3',5'-cyclic AMP phosphodiesterase CpdA
MATRSAKRRIVQISDTHLSNTKSHFLNNWAPLVQWLHKLAPDLIIHTGDVTVDGAGIEADLSFCRSLLGDLGIPTKVLPGNHDVGECHHPRQPVNATRMARWRSHFGADYWTEAFGDWRLIGLNPLLWGSDTDQEAAQVDWAENAFLDIPRDAPNCHLPPQAIVY